MLIENLPQVQALAPADKRRLIDELWHDLARQFADTQEALSDVQIAELLEKRFAEFLANPSSARSMGEVEIEQKFARLAPETQRILLDRLVRRVRARSELDAEWTAWRDTNANSAWRDLFHRPRSRPRPRTSGPPAGCRDFRRFGKSAAPGGDGRDRD